MRIVLAAALSLVACGGPKPVAPKPEQPPLETTSLPAITQGPGARWAIVASPKALFAGPLGSYVGKLVAKDGLDKLTVRLGFDLRASEQTVMVGFAATTFYGAKLPSGTAPSDALLAFEKRILPPSGRSNPRPDLVRVWGSMPSGVRGSAAGMWSTRGDVIVGEGGRLGPVLASMALAAGKLDKERALSTDKTFAPLLLWSKSAEIALLARCPLAEALGGTSGDSEVPKGNVLLSECFGIGLTLRPGGSGKLSIDARVTGAWGKDASAATEAMRATFASVAESDVGRVLGLRDVTPEVTATADAVDAHVLVDADTFATGLRRVLAAEIGDATK